MEWVSEQGAVRARLDEPGVFAERVHRHTAPIEVLFRALTDKKAKWWLQLQPGEVEPAVVEAVPFQRVVWSSFWPVSPDDTIRFDLSEITDQLLVTHSGFSDGHPTAIRMRWLTNYPPDERGVAITRQRLNRKIGGDLRAVTSAYYWETLPDDGGMPPPPDVPRPPDGVVPLPPVN